MLNGGRSAGSAPRRAASARQKPKPSVWDAGGTAARVDSGMVAAAKQEFAKISTRLWFPLQLNTPHAARSALASCSPSSSHMLSSEMHTCNSWAQLTCSPAFAFLLFSRGRGTARNKHVPH